MNRPADNVSAQAPTNADTDLDDNCAPAVRTNPKHARGRRRKGLLIVAAASIGLLGVGGGTAAAMSKQVVITVDGEQQEVRTLSTSVEGALATAGLQVGAHDVLAPSADTTISDGSHIVLERARPLDLTINGKEREIWTTADTVDEALVQLGQDPAALQLSANRSREIPLAGLALTADALRTVSISDAGKPATTVSTAAKTVADVLQEQGITLGATDTTEPALTAAVTAGRQITITRVSVKTVTQTVEVAPNEARTDDPKLNKGTTKVAVAGKPGQQKVVTTITTVNGKETSRKEVSRTIVVKATPNQIRVGTKSAPDVRGGRVFFHDTEFGVNWDGLAFCESTNNPKAVNNPSGFLSTYGLFQFDLPTWQSVGGSGNPGDAGPEEQLKRAKLLYQQRGLEPWLCGYAAGGPPAG